MPAIYGGLSLNPIQSASISEQTEYLPSGKLKLYLFNISVKGKIVPPTTMSATDKYNFIIAQQTAMINAFSVSATDNKKTFELQARNGAAPFKCTPRVKSLTFEEGTWVDSADYSIELEADSFSFGSLTVPQGVVQNVDMDDSWSIEINDEDKKFTKVTHRISAKSKDTDTIQGWEKAKAKVDQKIDATIPSDIISATGKVLSNAHNKKKSYRINKLGGEVSADVEITYHDPQGTSTNFAVHEQTLSEKGSSETARNIIGVEGNIIGLGADTSSDRYSPASALWATIKGQIESTYGTKTILSSSETHDKAKGIINYSYDIEDYPKPTDGSKYKKVSISQMGPLANPPKMYVIHQTIYGGRGPLFQDIGTKKVSTKTVTMEVVSKTSVELNTLQYQPANSIIESDSVQVTSSSGKKTRTTTFIWVA
jgi:hypothetical protein